MHSCSCFCIALFAFAISIPSQIHSFTTCHSGSRNKTGPVHRTNGENNSTLWFGCEGVSTTLQCYVDGFTAIHWRIHRNSTWKNISSEFRLSNAERCLTLPHPFIEAGSGLYKCVAEDLRGRTITNTFDIWFHKCGDGNFHISKSPPKRILRLPGTHVNMSCSGTYGDSDVNADHIIWIYHNGSKSHLVKDHLGKRFKVTKPIKSVENGLLTLTSKLEITDIRQSDYRDYTCIIFSRHDTRRQDNATTSLVKGDPSDPNGLKYLYKLLGIVLGVSIFLIVLGIVLYYKWRLDIKLYWMYHVKSAPPSDDLKHDVAIIFNEGNEDDETFVENELKPGLLKFGFSIYDNRLGYGNMHNYTEALETSRRFILILTPEALSTPWCQMKSEEVLQSYGKLIVFIVLHPISEEIWNRDEHSRGIKKAMKVIKKTLHVPSKNNTKMTHFWKELRLFLPVVQKKFSGNRTRDTSSTSSAASSRPLLRSEDQGDSGKGSSDHSFTSMSSDGKRGSNSSSYTPVDDEVFHFDNEHHVVSISS